MGKSDSWNWRRWTVMAVFAAAAALLLARALQLQLLQHDFFQQQGNARQQRTLKIPAYRGDVLDRRGEALAVSTPIDSVWADPETAVAHEAALRQLADIIDVDAEALWRKVELADAQSREFVYLRRHVTPDIASRVMAAKVPGVELQQEYRRYYPSGSAAAHVVGFTDIDDRGREGMEMAYEEWLRGSPGLRRVLRDMNGREIEGLKVLRNAEPGKDLYLSIDKQLQYFAERALVQAVEQHQAESASLVVMDVYTGEVMAMVNYPSYNPNNVSMRSGGKQRNRSITDVFEPGSTMKPFTIAAALESGKFKADDIVYTSPGFYKIGKYEVSDEGGDHGWLDLRGIIRKSSNVGVSKVATQLEPEQMWRVLDRFGFGHPTGSAFPGEVAGYFNHPTLWHHVEQATLSYGYGISVSALQLVRAYAAVANGGKLPQVSFVRVDDPDPGEQIIDVEVAAELRTMLEAVVSAEGTGRRAMIPGYRVAGKTGTSHRSQKGGYAEDRYVSLFAGFAPVSRPRFAAVVVVHDPKAGQHFGGLVSAPVFAAVMGNALRLSGIEPDAVSQTDIRAGVEASAISGAVAASDPAQPATLAQAGGGVSQ